MTKAYFDDRGIRLYCKDSTDMCELEDESVDLISTDPPYGIAFMGKDWDRALPDKRIWKECLRILKPGAFAFVMSIPRADCLSRMIIGLEDAGFWVNFTPIFWAYASGFPKAQNIGKAVDKRQGVERNEIGIKARNPNNPTRDVARNRGDCDYGDFGGVKPLYITEPSTPQAKALDGSYGGFQPKPAVEVIIVAMKPLSEKTFVDQALKNRKGITWLDDGRIPYENEDDKESARFGTQMDIRGSNLKTPIGVRGRNVLSSQSGRFPSNLLISDDVLNDGRDTKSGKDAIRRQEGMFVEHHLGGVGNPQIYHPDSGSFSRYFDLDKWAQKTFPFLIVPKASKSEKDKGLEGEEKRLFGAISGRRDMDKMENWKIDHDVTARMVTSRKNVHPTVKPLKLMSYLITLGSREGDMVVDPFFGTGSTAIACQILGRRCTGYEIKPEYCEIAKSRLTWHRQRVMNIKQ